MSQNNLHNLLHGVHAAHRFLHTKSGQDTVKTVLTAAAPVVALATPLAPLVVVGGIGYALFTWFKS
jgi:hypothetical protein